MLISKINLPVCGQCGGNISFGYKSIIKTLWLQGELPEVTKGLYGLPLSKETITNEHLEPDIENKVINKNVMTPDEIKQTKSKPLYF